VPSELYESEFFGHVRGSFTGAVKDRAGRFELADGGTLVLDEVGEIPLELQSKLLRVLQEGTYERVGDERTRKTDVRIVAATNRNLKSDVESGRFRHDLYYRLNVFPIEVAPLRERKEDIPLLAAGFAEQAARQLNSKVPKLTQAAVLELQRYDWPGNARELQNIIERAVITARSGTLQFDLPRAAVAAPAEQNRLLPSLRRLTRRSLLKPRCAAAREPTFSPRSSEPDGGSTDQAGQRSSSASDQPLSSPA
jgi:transcriptional regulator with GAF, ATPase, and Fis domain